MTNTNNNKISDGERTQHYKELLEKEKDILETELTSVGRINPSNPQDWEPTPREMNVLKSDKNEVADTMEEYETRTAIEVELENRLIKIKKALMNIEKGEFGKCEICGKDIEEDRLEANPSSTTCKAHING